MVGCDCGVVEVRWWGVVWWWCGDDCEVVVGGCGVDMGWRRWGRVNVITKRPGHDDPDAEVSISKTSR